MPTGFLKGWYDTGSAWVRIKCNAAGELITNIAAFLENPPTEDEAGKAATSEWSFDHNANANAHHTPPVAGDFDHNDLANIGIDDHHAKYTDAEVLAAINNILDANGYLTKTLRARYYGIIQLSLFQLQNAAGDSRSVKWTTPNDLADTYVAGYESGVGTIAARILIYDGAAYQLVLTDPEVDALILTHKNIVDAHHAKYTDAEAIAAVNMTGTLYWSCPGNHFDTNYPDTDDITKLSDGSIQADADALGFVAAVFLPNGATITAVIVYGNNAAEAETWTLIRTLMTDLTTAVIGSAAFNTEDSTLANNVVDNSIYSYSFQTTTMDTNDKIYGVRISYTL